MERFKNVLSVTDDARINVLLNHFDQICRRYGIEYMMDGGALVGSMLHHDRIPWDDDIDVYVRLTDRRRLTQKLQRNGFVVGSNGKYSKLWSVTFPHIANNRQWNWPFIDIGWLVQNATHSWEQRSVEKRYMRHVYPSGWLFPPVLRPFGELVLSAPRQSERVLEYRFGHDWSRMCVVNHWNHKLENWRYNNSHENTRLLCDILNVNLVHRVSFKNGTSFEWLVNHRTGYRGVVREFPITSRPTYKFL